MHHCSPPPGNVGTVHWTSPEVLNNVRYQFPADVYSFGMVLYEMVCGRVPFSNMLPIAVMMAVVLNKQQPDIPRDSHPELAELIRRWACLLCTCAFRWNVPRAAGLAPSLRAPRAVGASLELQVLPLA